MSAKEKAEEIIDKYLELEIAYTYDGSGRDMNLPLKTAIHCALICVEEIIKAKPAVLKGFEYELNLKYWNEVKEHLTNLN